MWEFTPQRKASQVIYHFWLLYLNALQCEIIILEKAIPIKTLKAFKFKFHKKIYTVHIKDWEYVWKSKIVQILLKVEMPS